MGRSLALAATGEENENERQQHNLSREEKRNSSGGQNSRGTTPGITYCVPGAFAP